MRFGDGGMLRLFPGAWSTIVGNGVCAVETEDKNRELLKATQDGDFVGVTRLLELGADPNYLEEKGTNRIHAGDFHSPRGSDCRAD